MLVPLAACGQCLLAAPTTQPFEPYTERIPGTVVKFDMVPIPAGKIEFSLDGKTRKPMEIKRFWISKFECRWDEFDTWQRQLDLPENQRRMPIGAKADAIGRPTPSYSPPDRGFGHSGYPVITVTPHAASTYCQWLSKKTGRKYRLPTPAEWEYACLAGEAVSKATDDTAWTTENTPEQTKPVGKKKPNAWGLYDMLGNAGEWTVTSDGKHQLLSGGWYESKGAEIHCGTRVPFDPAWQKSDDSFPPSNWWLSDGPFAGFRVVREQQ